MIHQFRIPSLLPVFRTHLQLLKLRLHCSQLLVFGSILALHTKTTAGIITVMKSPSLSIITPWFHAIFPSVPYSQSLHFSLLPSIFSILNLHLGLQPSFVLLPIRPWVQSLPSHTIFHSRTFISLLSMFVLLSAA